MEQGKDIQKNPCLVNLTKERGLIAKQPKSKTARPTPNFWFLARTSFFCLYKAQRQRFLDLPNWILDVLFAEWWNALKFNQEIGRSSLDDDDSWQHSEESGHRVKVPVSSVVPALQHCVLVLCSLRTFPPQIVGSKTKDKLQALDGQCFTSLWVDHIQSCVLQWFLPLETCWMLGLTRQLLETSSRRHFQHLSCFHHCKYIVARKKHVFNAFCWNKREPLGEVQKDEIRMMPSDYWSQPTNSKSPSVGAKAIFLVHMCKVCDRISQSGLFVVTNKHRRRRRRRIPWNLL